MKKNIFYILSILLIIAITSCSPKQPKTKQIQDPLIAMLDSCFNANPEWKNNDLSIEEMDKNLETLLKQHKQNIIENIDTNLNYLDNKLWKLKKVVSSDLPDTSVIVLQFVNHTSPEYNIDMQVLANLPKQKALQLKDNNIYHIQSGQFLDLSYSYGSSPDNGIELITDSYSSEKAKINFGIFFIKDIKLGN